MAIAVGREFGLKLQQVLGLEDQSVISIDLSVKPDEAVRCVVGMLLTTGQADQLAGLLQEYRLVPADSTEPEPRFCPHCLSTLEWSIQRDHLYCSACNEAMQPDEGLTHTDHAPEAAFIRGMHEASRAVECFMENMRNACKCELETLVRTGCQCGAMQSERDGCGRLATSAGLTQQNA